MPTNKYEFTASVIAISHPALKCFERRSDWGSLLWVINKKNDWRSLVIDGKKPEKAPLAYLRAELNAGEYDVLYLSMTDGSVLMKSHFKADGTPVRLALPDFTIDVFIKFIKK